MPKLLSINNYHYRRGGADAVYLEHASLMEEQAWSNAFFSMHHPNNISSPWSKYFVNEIEFGNSYNLRQQLSIASKVIYSREAQKKLGSLLNDYSPDVAHLHCIYHHLSPSILGTLKNAGLPVVMTAHDLKIACPAYKMLNQGGVCEECKGGNLFNVVRHRCVRNSFVVSAIVMVESSVHRVLNSYRDNVDKIIVPSLFFKNKFIEWGWAEDKFIYIPNYVDSARLLPHHGCDDYFLYFGRLAPEKGISTLLVAAAAAGVKLKIAGTGPIEVELKALGEKLGGDVEFLGYRASTELHNLVRRARAVVLPSEWYENAPISVLESFALGTPVIGANIGGIPEMVISGETGWTFTSGATEELSSLLSHVDSLSDAALARFSRCARDHACRHFSRGSYLRSMLDLYASLGVTSQA